MNDRLRGIFVLSLRERRHGLGALALFALFFLCFAARAEVAVPPLTARVTDLTATLSAQQRQALEEALRAFEARKGSQIAVLLVPTTQPETVEQYAIRVAEAWKLGRKGVDDGVLLLVAKQDRELRIEVGYGLEGVIPDAVANRVTDEIIVPYFRQGDFYGGIQAGVDRIVRLIDGEPLPPPSHKDPGWSGGGEWLGVAFIFVFVMGGILRAIFGRLLGAGIAGGVAAFVMWLILGSLFVAVIASVVVFVLVLAGGVSMGHGWRTYGGGYRGGGWSGGGGGGFRGGGGGFGGGGASGRW